MKRLGQRIVGIMSVDAEAFKIRLRFADGFVGTLCLGHVFERPAGLAAEVVKGGLFGRCFVESGALAWPNGLEFCPDAVRLWIEEQADEQAA